MSERLVRLLTLSLCLLGMAGCKCCGKKQCCPPPCGRPGCPLATQTVPPAQPLLPGPPGPGPVGPPPGPAAAQPGVPPAAPAWPPPSNPAPAPGVPGSTRYYAPAESRWEPAGRPEIRLAAPEAVSTDRKGPNASAVAQVDFSTPAPAASRALTPALPVGIPQFAEVQRGVASGLKPDLDGLDWLKANGFRTVVHVRAAGEDDSADRRQVEKRGLKFVSLECAPGALTRPLVEEFGQLTQDSFNQPVFVYDRDGSLAGGLWYLHFALNQRLPEPEARAGAARLGFKEEAGPQFATMGQAVRQLLGRQ